MKISRIIVSIAFSMLPLCTFAAGKLDNIIPLPKSITAGEGEIAFASCNVKFSNVNSEVRAIAEEFSEKLSKISGVKASSKSPTLLFKYDKAQPAEGYCLIIESQKVEVTASDYNGFIYGITTIKQLLPEAIFGNEIVKDADWSLKCCKIEDVPFFAYRGAHLDVCRHIFSKEEIKKYLDAMAMCKMNRFHWHLTEDQGWRIQIDSYPLLTKVGAWRKGSQIGFDRTTCDGVKYGGYYTKDDIREIVSYAKKLGIEVIPEVDLPGHMVAALAAYPELGCTGGPYEVRTCWGISKEVLCPAKESTFKFLEAVLAEVVELFPYEMFHIGGDECPKDAWKLCPACQKKIAELGYVDNEQGTKEDYLQSYVMSRVQNFLATKGKKVIGWDEILKGNPAPGTTIMHWRRNKDCTEASRRGFNTILVPASHLYIDHRQLADMNSCPPSINRNHPEKAVPFSKLYSFEPYKGLDDNAKRFILGVQCNLWTEYIATPEHLEYMAMPRMFATSEIQWQNPSSEKDINRVMMAVTEHGYKMLDACGFVYCTKME